jgi:hypothetical protein
MTRVTRVTQDFRLTAVGQASMPAGRAQHAFRRAFRRLPACEDPVDPALSVLHRLGTTVAFATDATTAEALVVEIIADARETGSSPSTSRRRRLTPTRPASAVSNHSWPKCAATSVTGAFSTGQRN